ncbi:efflux transporter outer membrane subunit [Sphingorhabdus sp. Alg239-R122]|uniref:efflux transporter outer membrane subunit n=1 Tax=Sphingorhabdus sp. Alg239-R122 TaxID=2305989 RepID=UPI0013DC448F|nr:efflux transporter outer membrane subunit [Sphingorhabdus sp. Alg239-R122]
MNRCGHGYILIALPLLLAGCASMQMLDADPALDPATVKLPATFTLATDVTQADRSALENLLPVGDPAFQELRRLALANGPTLAAAQARIDSARARAAGAGANRKPNIGTDAGVTGSRTNPDSFGVDLPAGINIDRYRTSFGANITANWDLDIFGGLQAAERAARIRINAATADAAATRLELVSAIAANVTDWRTLDARESVLRADIGEARDLVRLAEQRVRAGLAPGFDAVQAESLVAEAQGRIDALAAERARIAGSLVALTASDAATVMASFTHGSAKDMGTALPASTPADMLRARPDVAAAEARLAAADTDIAVAARKRFPKLTLSGALGLLTFALGDIFNADSIVGNLGAAVAVPLLDFGRIDAEIDERRAAARQAFADYRGTVFGALGDAEAAYGQTRGARAELLALDRQIALEKDAEYLASIRYRNGLADFSTVLNARRKLNSVRAGRALAAGRYARAQIALWLALGGSGFNGI